MCHRKYTHTVTPHHAHHRIYLFACIHTRARPRTYLFGGDELIEVRDCPNRKAILLDFTHEFSCLPLLPEGVLGIAELLMSLQKRKLSTCTCTHKQQQKEKQAKL